MDKKLIIVGIVLVLVFVFSGSSVNLGGGAGQLAGACTVSTETSATLGADFSSTLLAAHSGRAWARIQQPANATNTVNLSFNGGGAASSTIGLLLGDGNGTTTTNFIDFGRNTDFPYTGAVTGLTNLGSTTVHVTECRY